MSATPETEAGSGGPTGRQTQRARRGGLGPARWIIPLAPALFLLLTFFAGPILWTVWASFTNAALTGAQAAQTEFVGTANFERMFGDPQFRTATLLTVLFLMGCVAGQTVFGLSLALLLQNRHAAVRAVVGVIVVGAWVVPEVVAGFIWYAFLEREGSLNSIIGLFGGEPQNWLFTAPLVAVILANIWKGTAFSMMTYAAGLSEVPSDLKEAARVDGASAFQVLWHVVLPLLRRTLATTLLLVTLQTVQVFTLIYVMTSGGPGSRSTTLPLLMYQEALALGDLGYGTAIALGLLVVAGLFSLVYVRLLRTEETR
ncbi:multiple sugar transport system permease protein [Lipingzhangella halophila]|uniref:Multiple sugar transport system permease protein n=1 Tax=Lipingzhangella halophila TaxID=1783352 RepID=A0A7W7RFU5_9ACTN|nr:sugar ABC transporter permease [Lipingzhangella halophila]MBB4931180.1 multiple sugar transport system permease protein [Lipingzhangella halophila]